MSLCNPFSNTGEHHQCCFCVYAPCPSSYVARQVLSGTQRACNTKALVRRCPSVSMQAYLHSLHPTVSPFEYHGRPAFASRVRLVVPLEVSSISDIPAVAWRQVLLAVLVDLLNPSLVAPVPQASVQKPVAIPQVLLHQNADQ